MVILTIEPSVSRNHVTATRIKDQLWLTQLKRRFSQTDKLASKLVMIDKKKLVDKLDDNIK